MNANELALPNSEIEVHKLGWSQRRLLRQFALLHVGVLRVEFEGLHDFVLRGQQAGPKASIRVRHAGRLLRRVAWRGDVGFAESFIEGDWSTEDLQGLLYLLSLNVDAYGELRGRAWLAKGLSRLGHAMNRNTRSGSRRNIAAHYDLGNDFYARWLDPGMTYSSAAFDQTMDLEAAQESKYERMLNLIDPEPGDHILEIGCGWGGFAEHAARWGMRVTAVTLSKAQFDYTRDRVARAGLSDQVEVRLADYRSLEDQYDHIVSIEMFEAVGQDYWSDYFEVLARCLKPEGRAALQVITIRHDLFDQYVANAGGFIQKYIFPGGMLPTENHLRDHAWEVGLEPLGLERLGEHYADTLAVWHENFQRETAWLAQHGFDERFRRMWRYYLAFCEAGFRDGRIDLVQFAVAKEG